MVSTARQISGFLLTVLALAACQPQEPAQPETSEPRTIAQYSIEDLLDTTTYAGASFSPDGSKLLVSSNETGIFNAYSIPVAGGEPTALTESTDETIFAVSYMPSDERFLYTADQGGNELNHLFVRELDGSARDLTPGEQLKAAFLGFTTDDSHFLVATNERDQRYFDVYLYDITSYERERIFTNNDGYMFADLSPDERWIMMSKQRHNADNDLFLYDRDGDKTTKLTPHEGDVQHRAVGFSPDGKSVLFSTDEGSEFQHLVRHPLDVGEQKIGQRETLLSPDWDVSFAAFSKTGKYMTSGINRDGRTELKLFDAATMDEVDLPDIPNADITGLRLSRDDSQMAFYASSSKSPRDLFITKLDGGEPRQLTRSLSAKIDAEDLVAAEVVRFDSFDGVEIPGILYSPHGAGAADERLPALVWVHGGPGGQSRVGYNPLIQYLVNHGYVVYAINNRGSSGYGKTFFHLDDRDHGKGDLQDCIASKQMLVDTGYVDGERIGIVGGSYGGFMVLAALTKAPEEFAIGIDIFGVSNWLRTTQSIPPWWEAQKEALERELGDFDDEEFLRSISPLFHADKIVRPLMVIQGANDPRVIQAESDDIVAAARANGTPVEYIVLEDEGHGFRKKENQQRTYRAMLDFADHYLKGEAKSPANTLDQQDDQADDAANDDSEPMADAA